MFYRSRWLPCKIISVMNRLFAVFTVAISYCKLYYLLLLFIRHRSITFIQFRPRVRRNWAIFHYTRLRKSWNGFGILYCLWGTVLHINCTKMHLAARPRRSLQCSPRSLAGLGDLLLREGEGNEGTFVHPRFWKLPRSLVLGQMVSEVASVRWIAVKSACRPMLWKCT